MNVIINLENTIIEVTHKIKVAMMQTGSLNLQPLVRMTIKKEAANLRRLLDSAAGPNSIPVIMGRPINNKVIKDLEDVIEECEEIANYEELG